MLTLAGAHDHTGRAIDVVVDQGRVVEVSPGGAPHDGGPRLDLAGYLLTGAFVEPHAHLDKVFTLDRTAGHDGSLYGAMARFGEVLSEMTPAEIRERGRRGLVHLVRNGTTLVRSHVGCGRLLGMRAVEALAGLREDVEDLVDLELVAHIGPPAVGQSWRQHRATLAAALDAGADLVGGNPSIENDPEAALNECFQVAIDHGVGVDFHIDETLDTGVQTLRALSALARQVPLPVTASHCVSLGMLDPGEAAEIAAEVAEAGVSVVTLPATNLYLQGRGRVPTPRGLTALSALAAAGVRLGAGSDNTMDPFNPTGRLDPLQTASLVVVAGHQEPVDAWRMVGDGAREILGRELAGPVLGAVGDLVAVRAADPVEAVALAPADRVVLRAGTVVSRTEVRHTGAAECLN